jgi:hypothetical protein
MSSLHRWLGAVGTALVLAAPMSAQQAVPAKAGVAPAVSAVQVTATTPVISIAPTQASAALSVSITPLTAPATMVPLPPQGGQSENVALMIVGGTMMVVGSVIHGDTGTIIMVGGGAIGLVGLFRYLR